MSKHPFINLPSCNKKKLAQGAYDLFGFLLDRGIDVEVKGTQKGVKIVPIQRQIFCDEEVAKVKKN